ncbi:MAG: hypothetical protein IJD43_11385 [Thermoguttaceae bacterium]|nr:hypothetical protein [Thermoguttaceae bacterium]
MTDAPKIQTAFPKDPNGVSQRSKRRFPKIQTAFPKDPNGVSQKLPNVSFLLFQPET